MTSTGPTQLSPAPDFYDQDLLPSAPRPDTVLGVGGNDTILSSTLGGSQLEGNEGSDVLTARGPDDTVFGGTGNDSLEARSTGTRLIADDGRDTLSSDFPAELYGGAGVDLLIGFAGGNVLFGNQDGDTVLGGVQGGDSIYGGKGGDSLGFLNPGGQGNNLPGDDTVGVGGTNPGSNFVAGNLGDDLIAGVGASDSLYGGQDDDTVLAAGSNTFASGDLGDDELFVVNPFVSSVIPNFPPSLLGLFSITLQGGAGDDEITGGIGDFTEGGQYVLDGGDDNDTITSFSLRDSLEGGAGDDFLQAATVSAFVSPGVTTTSALSVFFGESTLSGGDGDDTLTSSSRPTDLMFGGGGDDSLEGFFTIMDGGDGNDTLDGSRWVVAGTTPTEVTLTGGTGDDFIQGATIDPAAQNFVNIIDGGEGNDTLVLNSTADELVGVQDGNDSIIASGGDPDFDVVLLDTLGANTLVGGDGDDSIRSGEGDDFIQGGTIAEATSSNIGLLNVIGAGDDTLIAGSGDDYLFGGTGADVLAGEAGDDTLQGGYGGDSLNGGEGADTFFYQFLGEVEQTPISTAQVTLSDLITEFDDNVDQIAFSREAGGFQFTGGGSELADEQFILVGNGRYVPFGSNPSAGTFTEPVLAYERETGFLLFDPDGAGNNDAFLVARLPQASNGSFPIITENDVTII